MVIMLSLRRPEVAPVGDGWDWVDLGRLVQNSKLCAVVCKQVVFCLLCVWNSRGH